MLSPENIIKMAGIWDVNARKYKADHSGSNMFKHIHTLMVFNCLTTRWYLPFQSHEKIPAKSMV